MRLADEAGHRIAARIDGKAGVTIFELRDCPISRKFSVEIRRLVRDFPSVRFSIVLVDSDGTIALARNHKRDFALPCSVLTDRNHNFVRALKISVVPTAVAWSKAGTIEYAGRIDDRFPTLGTELLKPRRADLRLALQEMQRLQPISIPRTPVVGCSIVN